MKTHELVELVIPAPCEWINANARPHWATRARLTSIWRHTTATRARLGSGRTTRFDGLVHITATVHKTNRRKYDAANLAPTAKAAVDGLRDAGWLVDDDNAHVIGPDMRAGRVLDTPVLVLTVEAAS